MIKNSILFPIHVPQIKISWILGFEKKEDIKFSLFQKLMLTVNIGCGTRIGNLSISNL